MKTATVLHRIKNEIDLPNQPNKPIIMEAENEAPGLLTITAFPEGQQRNAYYFHLDKDELDEYIEYLQKVRSEIATQEKDV